MFTPAHADYNAKTGGVKRARSNSSNGRMMNKHFQTGLKLIRLGCRARQMIQTYVDSNCYTEKGDLGGSGGSSNKRSDFQKRSSINANVGNGSGGNGSSGKRSDYRNSIGGSGLGDTSGGVMSRRSTRANSTGELHTLLLRSRYRRMLTVLYELYVPNVLLLNF